MRRESLLEETIMFKAFFLLNSSTRQSQHMFICICICLSMTSRIHAVDGFEETSIDTIATTWAKQQETVRSFRCTWKNTVTIAKETVRISESGGKAKSEATSFFPKADTTLEENNILTVENKNWRYESDGYGIESSRREFVLQHNITVLKDGVGKCYMPKGIYNYPLGNIVNMKETDYPQDISARPLFLLFRSLRKGLFKKEKYTILRDKGVVDGHSCLLLQTNLGISPKCRLWIDPLKDYLIRRYELSNDQGKVYLVMTISYSFAKDNRWLPSGWKIVNVNEQGDLAQSMSSTVAEIAINMSSNEQDFDIAFPPGTKVRDLRSETANNELTQYIAREGGAKRIITREERQASYEELLNTESGQAFPNERRGSSVSKWIKFVSIGVFGGCLLLIFLRRIQQKRVIRQ